MVYHKAFTFYSSQPRRKNFALEKKIPFQNIASPNKSLLHHKCAASTSTCLYYKPLTNPRILRRSFTFQFRFVSVTSE